MIWQAEINDKCDEHSSTLIEKLENSRLRNIPGAVIEAEYDKFAPDLANITVFLEPTEDYMTMVLVSVRDVIGTAAFHAAKNAVKNALVNSWEELYRHIKLVVQNRDKMMIQLLSMNAIPKILSSTSYVAPPKLIPIPATPVTPRPISETISPSVNNTRNNPIHNTIPNQNN